MKHMSFSLSYVSRPFYVGLLVLALAACGVSGTNPDVTAPTIVSTSPVDNETNVPTNSLVVATFSEGLNPATVTADTFTLTGPGTTSVSGTVTLTASNK